MKNPTIVTRDSGFDLDTCIDRIPEIDAATYEAAVADYDRSIGRNADGTRRNGRTRRADGTQKSSTRRRIVFGRKDRPNNQPDSLMSLILVVAADSEADAAAWRQSFPSFDRMAAWVNADETKAKRAVLVASALGEAAAKHRRIALAALDTLRSPHGHVSPRGHAPRSFGAFEPIPTSNAAAGIIPKISADYDADATSRAWLFELIGTPGNKPSEYWLDGKRGSPFNAATAARHADAAARGHVDEEVVNAETAARVRGVRDHADALRHAADMERRLGWQIENALIASLETVDADAATAATAASVEEGMNAAADAAADFDFDA